LSSRKVIKTRVPCASDEQVFNRSCLALYNAAKRWMIPIKN
jgi:hypothetical protein